MRKKHARRNMQEKGKVNHSVSSEIQRICLLENTDTETQLVFWIRN